MLCVCVYVFVSCVVCLLCSDNVGNNNNNNVILVRSYLSPLSLSFVPLRILSFCL